MEERAWLSVEQWDKDTLLETTARRVPVAVSIKLIFKNQWEILAGPPLFHCFCLASRCSKKYVPWVPSVKQYHFVGSKGHAFSVAPSVLWNSTHLEIWMAPVLLAFCKTLTNCLFPLALSNVVTWTLMWTLGELWCWNADVF